MIVETQARWHGTSSETADAEDAEERHDPERRTRQPTVQ
jgi:hypothetical protein